MKKILLSIVIILLFVGAYSSIAKGYHIGNLNIHGLSTIKEKNNELDNKIEEADKLKTLTYVSKISELNSAAKDLIKEKKTYEELITYSSEEDIAKANQSQKYEVEVLWTKIGMYAKKNGVKLKLDVTGSSSSTPNANDLKFIVTGSYISISDFVAELEKDAKLTFTIDNFALVPATTNDTSSSGSNLQATFKVKDIILNLNTTNIGVSSSTTPTTSSAEQSVDGSKNTTTSDNQQ